MSVRAVLARLLIGVTVVAGALAALFAVNGLVLAPGETPLLEVTGAAARPLREDADGVELRVLSYNIAKAFAYRQRLRFAAPEVIRARLDALAAVIRDADPDLVFLSEALHECPACGVSQVRYLAERTGAYAWLFGECYDIGLPCYRVSGGNAILSRIPIAADSNPSLVGRKPFYASANNRRALFGTVRVGSSTVFLGALHNDSRAGPDNVAQMRQILDHTAGRPTLLAGDFNAWPTHASLDLVRATGRFTPVVDAQFTFPSDVPKRTIDYIVAPSGWELLEYRVLDAQVSDHRPVFARFRCPRALCGPASAQD